MPPIELEPVESVRVTILMDNVTDPLLPDQESVTRVTWPKALADPAPRLAASLATGGEVPDPLLAEPGFSALVRVEKNEGAHTAVRHRGDADRDGRERA